MLHYRSLTELNAKIVEAEEKKREIFNHHELLLSQLHALEVWIPPCHNTYFSRIGRIGAL